MQQGIDRIIITEEQLAGRVSQLAGEITDRYRDQDQPVVLVPILNGAIVFLADLMRALPIKTKLGFMAVSSYPGRSVESRGAVLRTCLDDSVRLAGQHVLIVDDILDSGGTLKLVQCEIAAQKPRSMETVVLLRKPNQSTDILVRYVGFDIQDAFVVGYGLDYNGQYRNLPYIAVLKPERYV